MNGRNSSSQNSRPRTVSSSRPAASASKTLSSDQDINRLAINRSAALGSLYNARADCVLDKLSLDKAVIRTASLRKPLDCTIIKGDVFDAERLFRSIGITSELWLNLILNIVAAEGMAELADYTFPKTANTRFLFYSYTSKETSISQEQNIVRNSISKDMPSSTVTHVISSIKLGIQAFIVLQLPPYDQTKFDHLLEKIKEQLIENKSELSQDEKPLLDRIIITQVFSNISDLKKLSKIDDICQRIMQIKPHDYSHRPLQYTLRTIKWFYPSYSTERVRYIALESETINIIKQYLLSLPSKNQESEIPFNPEKDILLKENLKGQSNGVQSQMKEIQEMHMDEIKWLRNLVSKIRNGALQQDKIDELLTNKRKEKLQKHIGVTSHWIAPATEKKEVITDTERQDANQLYSKEGSIQKDDDPNMNSQQLMKSNGQEVDSGLDSDARKLNSVTCNDLEEGGTNATLNIDHTDISNSSINLPKANALSSKPSDYPEEKSEPLKLPASSTPEVAQPSDEYSRNIKEPSSPTGSPKLPSTGTSPKEKQSAHLNEQTNALMSLALSTSDKENKESLDSSVSKNRSGIENTSPGLEQPNDVGEPANISNSPSSSIPIPAPRNKKQFTDIEKTSNSLGSSNLPDKESTTILNEQTNDTENQCDVSKSSMISPPQVRPRANQHLSYSKKTLMPVTLLEPSTIEQMPPSEQQSPCTSEQANSPGLSPIVPSETAPHTEKQIEDIKEQSDQLKSSRPSTTEGASVSTEQSNHVKEQNNASIPPIISTSIVTPRERRRLNPSRLPTINYTNILLLGESGVGKSTFINALVNYLRFANFEQAWSGKPSVVMPVSFLLTVGDNFQEQIITFGDVDPNEDHDHPGRSVTQHCRSYVFQIGSQTKLRIIDTPGMGDTRGLDQDDLNMQHILSFINNLSHLNAICILLKPNESRLTVVLRSYFTRLLHFLGENARDNIIFCFTNTRATFYAPGDTGPLLRKMINKLPIKDIPFKKSNTFCFDSESFRYLIALQNGIEFDDYQKEEYKKSWIASVTESNRLIQYICSQLKFYSHNEWQSIEHAQFKISELIRPMLETMRNVSRNITLLSGKSSNRMIKLHAVALDQSSAICYKCNRIPKLFSDFWILPDDLHPLSDQCNHCDCPREKHLSVDYRLDYELFHYAGAPSFKEMKSDFKQIRSAMLEFAQFYAYIVDNLKQNDPILPAMKRMIDEESQICSQKDSTCLNSTLQDVLIALKKRYKERQTLSISNHIPVELSNVYEHIKSISTIDQISNQLDAMKQTQETFMQQHEKQVT